ncbi:MAG: MMPL family transporter [Planctomycetota bacterium]|nr:MMPL family transporter [Planctomycetota bacterium]
MTNVHPLRDRVLTWWARAATARPGVTLLVAAGVTVLSLWITTGLRFKSDRSDLIDPSLPWQLRYAEFKEKFPRWDDAVVVVDLGEDEASRGRGERFIAGLEARLRADGGFGAVTAGFAREEMPAGLLLTQPTERVRAVVEELRRVGPVLSAAGLEQLLGLSQLAGTSMPAEQREGLRGLLERIAAAGESAERGEVVPSVLGMERGKGFERLVTGSGRLATVLVSLGGAEGGDGATVGSVAAERAVNSRGERIAALRGHIEAVRSEEGLGGVEAGVTGVPVLESDETALSMRDATIASSLSLGLIAVLMLVAYRGVVVPLLSVASLLMGMAWSFAWATVSVGHLQLLSVTFASMLLGLGIDVAIHIVARLELVHADHGRLRDAVEQTFRGVGPGIVTASLTVAFASASMALTGFAGVGEMGIIAAGGIVLCTVSIMTCLPAMLVLLRRPEKSLRTHEGGESRGFMGGLGAAYHRRPRAVLAGAAAVLCGAGVLGAAVRYDPDLQKLVPSSTESVVWQNRLEADDARSVWHAVVLARDMTEARELTGRLRGLAEVSEVGGAGMLVVPEVELEERRGLLASLPDVASMRSIGEDAEDRPGAERAAVLRRGAEQLARRWKDVDAGVSGAAERVAGLRDEGLTAALGRYRVDRAELMDQIAELRGAAVPGLEALPTALREQFEGAGGAVLLRVYPRASEGGEGVLSPARLNGFARAVLGAAPSATGPAIQIYESSRLISGAYLQAGVYALVTIVLLLLVDFGMTRSGAGDAACALLPVLAGAVLMLAVMELVDVPLNFANMIVLPLMIGVGVGCGVHVVRRWRLQPGDEPPGLAGGSGRAITLTTLTTVIGFAAMMTGEHRGIWSLGFVMSVGLTAVWVVSVFVLPSVLKLRAGAGAGGGAAAHGA